MEKIFWFSLPITLLILYLIFRAIIKKPVSKHDINMAFAIYLMFYVFITAGFGLFWVARMDLPAFDMHYLFGYCLLFLVCIHLWFQLPHVLFWLKRNSPLFLKNETNTEWKPFVKYVSLGVLGTILFLVVTIIVYEFMSPARIVVIDNSSETSISNQRWLRDGEHNQSVISYIQHQGDITHKGSFYPRFNIAKPPIVKSYPHDSIISLPAPTVNAASVWQASLSVEPIHANVKLDLQKLSNLLYYSNGITEIRNFPGGQVQLHAAASAGALYPNDLYVVAIDIPGLTSGIYYYHPFHHYLIKIGDKTEIPLAISASPDQAILKQAAGAIIITAQFDRTIWKYHDRSYRYVLLDGGHILGNLAASMRAMNLSYITTTLFDDHRMETLLKLYHYDEGVISMVVIGKENLPNLANVSQFKLVKLPAHYNNIEVTRLSHQLTSIEWVSDTIQTRPIIQTSASNSNYLADNVIKLAEYNSVNTDLFAVIKNRRSFRQFSNHEVSYDDFSTVIRESYEPLKNRRNAELGKLTDLFIIVSRVKNLSHGVYRYIPDISGIVKINDGDFSTDIYRAGLSQEVLKRAAFVMVWVVDLNQMKAQYGDRGYRTALINGGLGSETAYLSSESRQLGACAVGAFYDDDVESILQIAGTSQKPILLTAIGQK